MNLMFQLLILLFFSLACGVVLYFYAEFLEKLDFKSIENFLKKLTLSFFKFKKKVPYDLIPCRSEYKIKHYNDIFKEKIYKQRERENVQMKAFGGFKESSAMFKLEHKEEKIRIYPYEEAIRHSKYTPNLVRTNKSRHHIMSNLKIETFSLSEEKREDNSRCEGEKWEIKNISF
ncbi:MAG: hypothetical protein KAU46_10530 [Candidatus Aminicenantes bacterium]|nr:hypothetical protein [Candidatus Aminicenantes bacterium]